MPPPARRPRAPPRAPRAAAPALTAGGAAGQCVEAAFDVPPPPAPLSY
jgi:hypothetical protein